MFMLFLKYQIKIVLKMVLLHDLAHSPRRKRQQPFPKTQKLVDFFYKTTINLFETFLIAKASFSLQPLISGVFSVQNAASAAEGMYVKCIVMFYCPFPDFKKFDINSVLDPETVSAPSTLNF